MGLMNNNRWIKRKVAPERGDLVNSPTKFHGENEKTVMQNDVIESLL